jgi:hypothetical protein
MQEENAKIHWVSERLGAEHPAQPYLVTSQVLPLAVPYKRLGAADKKLHVEEARPDRVEEALRGVVADTNGSADTLGHIAFERVVRTYAECAEQTGTTGRQRAEQALRAAAASFRKRGVIDSVVQELEQRAARLA